MGSLLLEEYDVIAGLGISEQCEALHVQVAFPSWLHGAPNSPEA